MYKVMSIMQKPESTTLEAWRNWALVEHPKLARQIPGMVKYSVDVVRSDDPDLAFHSVSEMYFADEAAFKSGFASDAGKAMVARIPQRRLGQLEDLDGPLLLLASDASAYMTGSAIVVDGGHLHSTL